MGSEQPRVSIIIPTRNAQATIKRTLESLNIQTFRNIEIIVVDNFSTDGTLEVVQSVFPTARVLEAGPERSAQKNAGAKVATGKYLYFIDSDFVLEPGVITEAVRLCEDGYDAAIIHNTSHPAVSFWAKVRKLERDCYYRDPAHVAARFVRRDLFLRLGGYDELLVAGEDYDLQSKLSMAGAKMAWCKSVEYHLGEPKNLLDVVTKHVYYGRYLLSYVRKQFVIRLIQLVPFRRSYVWHIDRFLRDPLLLTGFLIYQYVRYASATAGLLASIVSPPRFVKSLVPTSNKWLDRDAVDLRKKVSIILVTRNRPTEFRECIQNLLPEMSAGAELIVIDDHSNVPYSNSSLPYGTKIVRNQKRLFLNASRNLGASLASRPYLLFLDDDNLIHPNSVELLVNTLESLENVAVVCPLILASDGLVWYAGGWISVLSGLTVFNYRGTVATLVPRRLIETNLFHSCFMIRRSIFSRLHGFDARNFPMYLAEADLSERLERRGYKVVLNPNSRVVHHIETRGLRGLLRNIHITEPARAYFVGRNRILFMRSHRNKFQFMIFLTIFQPIIAFIHLITIMSSKSTGFRWTHLAGAYMCGLLDGIMGRISFGQSLILD